MKRHPVASAVMLLTLGQQVLAQAPTPSQQPTLERVTVTGSSIKRLADQRALPIETFSRTQIEQLGLASADQLVDLLAANAAGSTNQVTNNAVFGSDADKTLGGGNFANLRGLGSGSTLVLLNGRRVATHGMSGGAVDLNSIPIDAIERTETLKDGASAIYGTDAIGGVINFITRSNFEGLTLRASYSTPEAKGGGQLARVSATAGIGNLARDGWNLMASLSLDDQKILRGTDRAWATGFQPERFLTPESTSSVHANIISQANSALPTTGSIVGDGSDATRYTNLNLLAIQGRCQEFENQVPLAPNAQIWDRFGYTNANSRYRCTRDYGRNYMLRQPQEAANAMVRGTFDIGVHRAAIELLASKVSNRGEYAPAQLSTGQATTGVTAVEDTRLFPTSPHYIDLRALAGAQQFDPARPIAYRVNFLNDLGFRIRENETDNLRLQATMDGQIGGLDYSVGLGTGSSKSSASLINGFFRQRQMVDLLKSGKYNPFLMPGETQSADVVAAFEAMQARGKIYDGKTTVKQADGTLSGSLGKFLAGDLEFAAGLSFRQETYEFSGSINFDCIDNIRVTTLANSAAVFGCPGNTSSPKLSRDIGAVFGELLVRPLNGLEVTLQVRHDEYQKVGGTTNPKIGLKFQPFDSFMLRASASTGFRAPSPQQIRQGVVESVLTGQFRDPELCADINNPIDASQCARLSMPFRAGGNPSLKPEESKQASVGLVFAPTQDLLLTADFWQVQLEDRIRSLSVTGDLIPNYSFFRENFVRDPSTNIIQYIQAGWVNAADSKTRGVDLGIQHLVDAFGGRITSALSATKMFSHKERALPNAPLVEYVGKWQNTTLFLPWRVNASVGYRTGPINVTLSGIYRSGYEDEDRSGYTAISPTKRDIKAYTSFNLVGTYTGFKNLSITGSILNLFDTKPPFTWHNVDVAAGAGWDPRVADPRGRTYSLALRYDFR
jgi:iron complex outermembrane recepter protein